jgi:hypothetical protein
MIRIFLFLFLVFSCVTVNDRRNLKIEPIAFRTCYLQDFTNKEIEFKNEFTDCDFISINKANSEDKNLLKKIFSFFEADSNFLKRESQLECKNLSELQNGSNAQNPNAIGIFCYKKNTVLEIVFTEYSNNDDFTNPIFFILIDLINQRKILFANFEANPNRRRELIEFDKLISFTSQNFSDRKPFLSGKFFLNTQYHSDLFLKNLSFPYILINLVEAYSKVKTDFSILTDSMTYKNCQSIEKKTDNFFKMKCEF